MHLISLQLETTLNFKNNLIKLQNCISKAPNDSIILAPELYLNGYSYNRLSEAITITNKAIPLLKELSTNKTIAITMTTKQDNNYLNTLHIFAN